MKIIHRTTSQDGPGWRLNLPVLLWWRRDYSVRCDAYVTGWWWFSIALAAERIGRRRLHGVGLRFTWGWWTTAVPAPQWTEEEIQRCRSSRATR